MKLADLLQTNANISVTITLEDLRTYSNELIQSTKKELEAEVMAQQNESYLTWVEACDFLKVKQTTLYRWANRGYLVPIQMGGKRMYRKSDLQRILNGRRA